jgi:hypothetical protein
MPKITVDTVVEAYVNTRAKIKELEDQISELKAYQAKKEEWLQQQLHETGAENMKTKHGTVYTTVFESCTVADADTFFDWVRENQAWEFLERRVSKAPVLHMMGDREDNGRPLPPPPGVNYTAIKKIGVRKG